MLMIELLFMCYNHFLCLSDIYKWIDYYQVKLFAGCESNAVDI